MKFSRLLGNRGGCLEHGGYVILDRKWKYTISHMHNEKFTT